MGRTSAHCACTRPFRGASAPRSWRTASHSALRSVRHTLIRPAAAVCEVFIMTRAYAPRATGMCVKSCESQSSSKGLVLSAERDCELVHNSAIDPDELVLSPSGRAGPWPCGRSRGVSKREEGERGQYFHCGRRREPCSLRKCRGEEDVGSARSVPRRRSSWRTPAG